MGVRALVQRLVSASDARVWRAGTLLVRAPAAPFCPPCCMLQTPPSCCSLTATAPFQSYSS
jgi:hypothetical protein